MLQNKAQIYERVIRVLFVKLPPTYQVFALESELIRPGEEVFPAFIASLEKHKFQLEDDDIVVIASKVFSYQDNLMLKLDEIEPSAHAKWIAKKATMDPRVAEVVIRESNNRVIGWVYRVLLTETEHGLSANAGIDLSNAPPGYVLLLPRNPDEIAKRFRKRIQKELGKSVGVIIIDSRTIPLRKGTSAIALGISGLPAIIDERGKTDLYGYKMMITTRALADNIGTAATILMGETNEKRPFAVVRGLHITQPDLDSVSQDASMPPQECLYVGPLYSSIKEKVQKIQDENL